MTCARCGGAVLLVYSAEDLLQAEAAVERMVAREGVTRVRRPNSHEMWLD